MPAFGLYHFIDNASREKYNVFVRNVFDVERK